MEARTRWATLWTRLGSTRDHSADFDDLVRRYAEPQRAYHTLDHILDCLSQFDRARTLAARPDEVEMAIWFHDAVYDPHASDNEQRSADLAADVLRGAGVAHDAIDRIRTLILDTRHIEPPGSPDGALLVDIDLSILGRDRGEFDRYERNIRREYCWVEMETYRTARTAILRSFLNASTLYRTPLFRDLYERRARENLEESLRRL